MFTYILPLILSTTPQKIVLRDKDNTDIILRAKVSGGMALDVYILFLCVFAHVYNRNVVLDEHAPSRPLQLMFPVGNFLAPVCFKHACVCRLAVIPVVKIKVVCSGMCDMNSSYGTVQMFCSMTPFAMHTITRTKNCVLLLCEGCRVSESLARRLACCCGSPNHGLLPDRCR